MPLPQELFSALGIPMPSSSHGCVYQDSIALLRLACAQTTTGIRPEATRLEQALESYLTQNPPESNVDSIVQSLGCRILLLELSAELNLSDDSAFRDAFRADERRIASLLVDIFGSKVEEGLVLRLEGDSAQCFLDVVQDIIDRGFLVGPAHSRKARRIIRKLSESCDKLPSSLFIDGVTGRDFHPTFGGGFADVYRASYGDKTVALKYMRHFLRGSELRRVNLKFCREALVWKDLHHPHILPFLGVDRESFFPSLCMVSPWMEHGTVLTYLKVHGHAQVDKLLFEIAQGLHYLHSHDIVHGDLRGANILINEEWNACLSDFGLSSFSNATASMHTSTRSGSIYWMAPELITPERFGLRFSRTPASDVYAYGCVCIELYTGRPPFADLNEGAALLAIASGQRPDRPSADHVMSERLWTFVSDYWSQAPTMRPTAEVVARNMVWPFETSETVSSEDGSEDQSQTPTPSAGFLLDSFPAIVRSIPAQEWEPDAADTDVSSAVALRESLGPLESESVPGNRAKSWIERDPLFAHPRLLDSNKRSVFSSVKPPKGLRGLWGLRQVLKDQKDPSELKVPASSPLLDEDGDWVDTGEYPRPVLLAQRHLDHRRVSPGWEESSNAMRNAKILKNALEDHAADPRQRDIISKFHSQCSESQEAIVLRIAQVKAGEDREDLRLLAYLLHANEKLVEALDCYDGLSSH